MRPLSRHYFVLQTNPGEQFYMFTSLAAWLIQKCGTPFDQPQEFDDPNSTISNILDVVRKNGVTIDFPPSKLKQVPIDACPVLFCIYTSLGFISQLGLVRWSTMHISKGRSELCNALWNSYLAAYSMSRWKIEYKQILGLQKTVDCQAPY